MHVHVWICDTPWSYYIYTSAQLHEQQRPNNANCDQIQITAVNWSENKCTTVNVNYTVMHVCNCYQMELWWHTHKYTMNYALELHWPCFYIQYTYISIVCTMYIWNYWQQSLKDPSFSAFTAPFHSPQVSPSRWSKGCASCHSEGRRRRGSGGERERWTLCWQL